MKKLVFSFLLICLIAAVIGCATPVIEVSLVDDGAESLYRRSLAIRENTLGADHTDVAISLDNLAEFYRVQGKYDKAEQLFYRSLTIREKALGPDPPATGSSLNNLVLLYKAQGRTSEAEPLFQRSLAIVEKR